MLPGLDDDFFFYYWLAPAVAVEAGGAKAFIFYVGSSPGFTFYWSSYYNDY